MSSLVGPGVSGRAGTSLPGHETHSQMGPGPRSLRTKRLLVEDVSFADEVFDGAGDLEHLEDRTTRVDDTYSVITTPCVEQDPKRAGIKLRDTAQVELRRLA